MPKEPKESKEGTPSKFAVTNPAQAQDFSYLEIVMELQKSMAQMSVSFSHLAEASKSHDSKLEAFSNEMRDKVAELRAEVRAARASVKVAAWLILFFIALLTLAWAVASRLIWVPTTG